METSNKDINEIIKAVYLAGLFDGEGCVTYKQYWEKRKSKPGGRKRSPCMCWRINLEIAMTCEKTIQWCKDNFPGNMTIKIRPKPFKTQWRWRAGFRQAEVIAKIIYPHAKTKKDQLKQIIDHYKLGIGKAKNGFKDRDMKNSELGRKKPICGERPRSHYNITSQTPNDIKYCSGIRKV